MQSATLFRGLSIDDSLPNGISTLTGVHAVCQILTGIYPIAQVREPYTAVGYLAQRTALVEQLQLAPPQAPPPIFKKTAGRKVGDWELEGGAECSGHVKQEEEEEEVEWTAWDICDGVFTLLNSTLCYSLGYKEGLLHLKGSLS